MSTKPGKTKPNTSDLKDGGKGTSDDGKNKKGNAGGSSLKGSSQSENGARVNPSNIEIGGPPLTDHTLDNLEDDMSAFDRDKKTPSLTISLDLINDAVASALSHFKKQPGVKLSGVMSKDEVEQVFMDIFAQVSSTTSSMLTPEITTLRKLAHTMEQNAKETREIQNQVLMLMQQGATEKVVAKTVQELVPNPAIARNNKKIVEGLMSLGVMFENPEKKLKLSKALSVLKPNEILKFVEACAGETPDGIRELFKKYKK